MITTYSEAEQKLIRAISEHFYNLIQETEILPGNLYDLLALECFVQDRRGPEVDALRKVVGEMHSCSVYRLTPAFDSLCWF